MDDRIRNALEHPPRADAPRDPALVAAVMGRVRELPSPAERRRARVQWAAAAAIAGVIAAALCALPVDLDGLLRNANVGSGEDVAVDGVAALALVAVVMVVAVRRRTDAA